MIANATADLRYVDIARAAVAGRNCGVLTVRNASRVIGQLQGFVIDRVTQRLRYLVVATSGLLERTLMPVTAARIDLERGAIELLDPDAGRLGEPFRPELFKPIADDDKMHAA